MTLATTTIHRVWYHKRIGSLTVSDESVALYDDDDQSLVVSIDWKDTDRIAMNKQTNPNALLQITTKGGEKHRFKFETWSILQEAHKDMKSKWSAVHPDQAHAHHHDSSVDFDTSVNQLVVDHQKDGFPLFVNDSHKNQLPSTPASVTTIANDPPVVNDKHEDDEKGGVDDAPPLCNCRCAGILLLVSLAVLAIEMAIVGTYLSAIDVQNEDTSYTPDEFYVHDALVATTVYGVDSGSFSLDELMAAATCAADPQEQDQLQLGLRKIVDFASTMFTTMHLGGKGLLPHVGSEPGRIVEHVEETVVIGDNYEGQFKGVTLACVLARGYTSGLGPAAYAGNMLWSVSPFVGASGLNFAAEPGAYNVSMMLEADVMELGSDGILFFPKKYCFDFTSLEEKGVMKGSKQSTAHAQDVSLPPISVNVGGKVVALPRLGKRVTWLTNIPLGPNFDAVEQAYYAPKAELLGLIGAARQDVCFKGVNEDECLAQDGIAQALCLAGLDSACLNGARNMTENYFKLEWDPNAVATAFLQLGWMVGIRQDWKAYTGLLDEVVLYNFTLFSTPFLFDKTIANRAKNSLLFPSYASPYFNREVFNSTLATPYDETAADCVPEKFQSFSSDSLSFAGVWKQARQRRLAEFGGNPATTKTNEISQWFIDVGDLYGDASLQPYLKQTIKWDSNTESLAESNLTEKRMGRTADWLVVNAFDETEGLHQLLARQQDNSDAYARAASRAVRADNKCGWAATNTDLFVLVLGIAATFCGGVNAFMQTIHLMLNCIFVRLRYRNRHHRAITGWKTIWPTYELGLTLLGTLVFFSLYLPFLFQVIDEFEIYNFGSSGADMVVHKEPLLGSSAFYGDASLITIAYMDTKCSEARPFLLLTILVNGLVIGILVNLPHVLMSYTVLCRYLRRLRAGGEMESEVPKDVTVYDEGLRIIHMQYYMVVENPLFRI